MLNFHPEAREANFSFMIQWKEAKDAKGKKFKNREGQEERRIVVGVTGQEKNSRIPAILDSAQVVLDSVR